MSPILWNPALNAILATLENGGGKVLAYADDVAIAVSGKYPSTLTDIFQGDLQTLSRRVGENGLGVNPGKTELVLFTRRYKIPTVDPIILNGSEIKLAERAKYLGVILDSKLSFSPNIVKRTKKVTIAL